MRSRSGFASKMAVALVAAAALALSAASSASASLVVDVYITPANSFTVGTPASSTVEVTNTGFSSGPAYFEGLVVYGACADDFGCYSAAEVEGGVFAFGPTATGVTTAGTANYCDGTWGVTEF